MPEMKTDELSAKIAALEKPVARFSFERWKFSLLGTFIGMAVGSVTAFVVPKETVRNNKFLNRQLQPDNMTDNIYPSSVAGYLSWIGGLAGSITDMVRDFKRPVNEEEYRERIAALKQQASGLFSQDSNGDEATTRMQEMVSSKRQELASQRTR